MTVTFEEAQEMARVALGISSFRTALPDPRSDPELMAIKAREIQFLKDDQVSPRTQRIDQHIRLLEKKKDDLIYNKELTLQILQEIGLLEVSICWHIERIESGCIEARDLKHQLENLGS